MEYEVRELIIRNNALRFRALINKIENIIAIFVISLLSVVVFLQVFFRYVLNNPLAWSEELARFLAIWLVYISAAIVLRDDSHMSMDYFVKLFSPKVQAWADVIGKIIISTFLLVGIKESFKIIRITMSQLSPSLDIPMGLIYLALPTSFSLMLLDFITRIILRKRKGDATV